MWALQQDGPGAFRKIVIDPPRGSDLRDGEVLVSFLAGSICGSDIPKFLGHIDPFNPETGKSGSPLHELVGTVVESRSDDLAPGSRVVGRLASGRGLAELVTCPADNMIPVDGRLGDTAATIVQPLATVFSALDRVPDLASKRIAVIGLGPLGLLFTHVLRSLGVRSVTGIDRVDRSDCAEPFGIHEVVADDATRWAAGLGERTFNVVIDVVGHSQEVIAAAVDALAPRGHLLVYGLPDAQYVFPIRPFFRKNATMYGSHTDDWRPHLHRGQAYLLENPQLPDDYITHVFPIDDAQEAYRLYSLPAVGRLKVSLTR